MESRQIELSTGARVFVASRGRGDELVVFLHAVGADHTMWYLQMEALDPDRYTLVGYDLRGHGRSAFDIENTMVREAVSIGGFAKDTISLIDHLGFRRAHVVGLSMGGAVALEVFKRRSDVVQSLTLANTASNFPDAESSAVWMQQQLATKSMAESARELVPKMFAADAPPELVERAIQIEGAKSHHIYLASWNSLLQSDYRRVVEMIDVPLLLIGGTADTFTPTDPSLTSMQSVVPTAELVDIAGAGHYSNLDHSGEFSRALRSHLLRARSNGSQRAGIAEPTMLTVESPRAMLARRGVQTWIDSPLAMQMAEGHWRMSGAVQAVLGGAPAPSPVRGGEAPAPHYTAESLDRAIAIASSDGTPLVLALPNDAPLTIHETSRVQPSAACEPSSDALETAARLINVAQRPIVVTSELGRFRGGAEALVQLAQRHAVPVIEQLRTFFNFPTRHPMHLGFNASPFVKQADLILAVATPAPWDPDFANVSHQPRVIQIAVDPLRTGVGFPSDLTLAGDPALTIRALTSLLDKRRPDPERIAGRYAAYSSEHRRVMQAAQTRAISDAAKPAITKQFLSYCVGEAIDDRVVIFDDAGVDPQLVPRRLPDSWFAGSLGHAAGAQLAAPDLTIVATLSANAYVAASPLAAHAQNLPLVTIVMNDGAMQLEKAIESAGGIGIKVTAPRDLPSMLKRALTLSREQRVQVLVDVRCERES